MATACLSETRYPIFGLKYFLELRSGNAQVVIRINVKLTYIDYSLIGVMQRPLMSTDTLE